MVVEYFIKSEKIWFEKNILEHIKSNNANMSNDNNINKILSLKI